MKKAIQFLRKEIEQRKLVQSVVMADDGLQDYEAALKILQLHNRNQQAEVNKKLDAEGLNGLINALESMRASGINRVEIEDCGDYVIIKEWR